MSFYPDTPKDWNRIAWVMREGNYTHKQPFYWQIATVCDFKDIGKGINRYCRDLTKTAVEKAFVEAFGYGSFESPQMRGKKVIKSETNAVHDGRIVVEPYTLKKGEICQRFIETRIELRVPIVWGEAACVCIKEVKEQFKDACTFNTVKADFLLSRSARERIAKFCELIGMDYGELDILKDPKDGRWYIIDANQCPGYNESFFKQTPEELDLFVTSHKALFE